MLAQYQLTPWGEVAQDQRDATIGFAIGKAALGNAIKGEDFAVKFNEEPQTPEQMKAVLRAAAEKAKE